MVKQPNILILAGKGKSALTKIIQKNFKQKVYYGFEEANKFSAIIKKESSEKDISVIIHLNDESDFGKLSIGLRRRAIAFVLCPLIQTN